MNHADRRDLVHDLILPTLLFAAVGGMTWAVRGSSGFGAMKGCMFAGLTWGITWWFLARDRSDLQSRPYSTGWIILAMTYGVGISGMRGWMQWPSFFLGQLQTDAGKGLFVPIDRSYGFLWLFIAGVPWAGLGACFLAWCNNRVAMPIQQWIVRIGVGLLAGYLAGMLFDARHDWFLPMYDSLKARYLDLDANPNLRRLINDSRAAIVHLGWYLGFLGYELARRNWRNVVLISTVGLLNGIGWSLLQNWKWAYSVWPGEKFNFWRCWESSGGISIGIALGIGYYLSNARVSQNQAVGFQRPSLERFGTYAGVIIGLGFALKNGIRGWANIYLGNEKLWETVLWRILGPTMLVLLVAAAWRLKKHPAPRTGDPVPNDYAILWLVLVIQNILAQAVTGPHRVWSETVFALYYFLLFLLSAVIVIHFHQRKRWDLHWQPESRPGTAASRLV